MYVCNILAKITSQQEKKNSKDIFSINCHYFCKKIEKKVSGPISKLIAINKSILIFCFFGSKFFYLI